MRRLGGQLKRPGVRERGGEGGGMRWREGGKGEGGVRRREGRVRGWKGDRDGEQKREIRR